MRQILVFQINNRPVKNVCQVNGISKTRYQKIPIWKIPANQNPHRLIPHPSLVLLTKRKSRFTSSLCNIQKSSFGKSATK